MSAHLQTAETSKPLAGRGARVGAETSGWRIAAPFALVFLASGCMMVVELVAGRILAPYVGVSLYTWTSVIGVVLAGMSTGNVIGGAVADRVPGRTTLAVLFAIASLATLAILGGTVLLDHLSAIPSRLGLQWRILALTVALFFLPSAAMGTISPVVAKLTLRNLASAGNVVGRIYACGALGSIVGTFLTGFWLIALFGTRRIIVGVAVVLLVLALASAGIKGRRAVLGRAALVVAAFAAALLDAGHIELTVLGRRLVDVGASTERLRVVGSDIAALALALWVAAQIVAGVRHRRWKPLLPQLAVAGLALAFAGGWRWAADHGRLQAPCARETSYYCIRVDQERLSNGHVIKRLVLDHLIHSYADVSDPTYLEYGYETVFAELTAYQSQVCGTTALKTLFIGGGGYTFPRFVEATYPGSAADVLEIDPAVTQTAVEQLGLRPGGALTTRYGDARASLRAVPRTQQYDLIFGDAFNDLSVPYHLTTREFDALVHQALRPGGYYMANVIDNYRSGQFVKAFLRTLHEVFPYVSLVSNDRAWDLDAQNTYVVVGSDRPFDEVDFTERLEQTDRGFPTTQRLAPDRLARDLAAGPQIVLTDDYAPVDNLIAPLFTQRGF